MISLTLTPEQFDALDAIGRHKTLFLTGAAGCGKSVIITEKMKADTTGMFILCATTNQAARILSEKLDTGKQVPTLQSVLDMKPIYDGSTKNADNLLDFVFSTPAEHFTSLSGCHLIIDEASMICRNTQNYLLKLVKLNHVETVTFVGDKWQLPCVKNEAFDYSVIEKEIELHSVKRAKGDLLEYYNQIRADVMSDEPITIPTQVKHFDTMEAFAEYINAVSGSKCVISWTNAAADTFSKVLDASRLYEGQQCTALGQCHYQHLYNNDARSFCTNSTVVILKLFRDYDHMKRTAANEGYEYRLPKKPQKVTLKAVLYAKVRDEKGRGVYVSIWDSPAKEKETLYLNHMTREYRKYLDSIKRYISTSLWNRYAKEDGYPKSLSNIRKYVHFPQHMIAPEEIYWNDFFAISEAIPLRSIFSTTAHRVQGTTVDVAGINWTNISKCNDKRLQYVALTRASKELVIFTGAENEAV